MHAESVIARALVNNGAKVYISSRKKDVCDKGTQEAWLCVYSY